MKKIVMLFVSSAVFLVSCQKNNSDAPLLSSPDALTGTASNQWTGDINAYSNDYYVNLILHNDAYSRYFVPVLENTVRGNKSLAEELYTKGGIPLVNQFKSFMAVPRSCSELNRFYLSHDVDTSRMYDNKAEVFSSWALFMQKCPVFLSLSDDRKSAIFTTVMGTLKRSDYRERNPGNMLVIAYNNCLLLMKPNTVTGSALSGRLTSGEVMDCLGGTITGALAGSSALIRDFVNVINGTNLGWSGIKSVAKSFFRTLVGSNALGATIGFAACIAWETFF